MPSLEAAIDELAERTSFSGAVRVDAGDGLHFLRAYGLAHRGWSVANTVDTRFGIASGTKAFTALTVLSLVQDGRLDLSTRARSVLGADLPVIGEAVTVEHLLAHRSGIGDYLDEDAGVDVLEHPMPVPVHRLATTGDYLEVLGRRPPKFPAGERFSYCNEGYVVLALIAERAGGLPFPELVARRVCEPAGLLSTEFLRSDELPGGVATGYLDGDGLRTNVLHLPVRGSGDGGLYSTVADIRALWEAVFAGRIVDRRRVEAMVRPRSDAPRQRARHGLGFWLHPTGDAVTLEGCDAGVSFRSVHAPSTGITHTVLSNTTRGAWPVTRLLDEMLDL